ncbi:hypothetical protein [Streptomyces sp. NBC_01589]|uniref:hypothetical protein n=1 Tax=unclassified Streptomyces TaxID=2593676 RepID=UPI00386E7737
MTRPQRGCTDRGDDDTRGDGGDWGGGGDWGADVRAREDPDGVNTRGSTDPPVDEFGIQTRIQAGFDPPVDESSVQSRIQAGF